MVTNILLGTGFAFLASLLVLAVIELPRHYWDRQERKRHGP